MNTTDTVTVTVNDLMPFLLMVLGVILIAAGFIWQIGRQHRQRQERNTSAQFDVSGTTTITDIAPSEQATELAYRQGWHDSFGDSIAISEYHREADLPENNNDPGRLAAVWEKVVERARDREAAWNALSTEQKLIQKFSPFWKQDKGQPRRIPK